MHQGYNIINYTIIEKQQNNFIQIEVAEGVGCPSNNYYVCAKKELFSPAKLIPKLQTQRKPTVLMSLVNFTDK